MNLRFHRAARRSASAWTLVEMMIVVGIGTLLMAVVMQSSVFTARSFVAMGNYCDLDRYSRNTLDQMSRDIRAAKLFSPQSSTTNCLVFTNLDSSYFAYWWDPRTKNVYKITGTCNKPGNFMDATTNCVLTGCDFFSFRIWQRNPAAGFTFPDSSESNPMDTKLVDVSWRCVRHTIDKINTESVQTARIVLRN